MSWYQELIMKTLNCDATVAEAVEDIMRQDIFHSTLDWQTKKQLEDGAKEAYEIYCILN